MLILYEKNKNDILHFKPDNKILFKTIINFYLISYYVFTDSALRHFYSLINYGRQCVVNAN